VPGAAVGPLTKAVLVNQFTRTRDGDRFFFLNTFSGAELQNLLANTSLSKIIQRDTATDNLQADVFHFRVSISGTVFDDDNKNGRFDSFEHGMSGVTVTLTNDAGAVLATDVTDANGRYSFNQFDIQGTGHFTVTVSPPAGLPPTTPTSVDVLISRGDINARVNFGIDPPSGAAPTGSSSTGSLSTGAVTHFAIQGAGQATAGSPTAFIVAALDATNHVVTNYTGTVHFSSSDGGATLPADYTFTPDDQGTHQFTVTFGTAGAQTLSVTDVLDSSITVTVPVTVT
jgi:hypothetical protein